MGPDANNMGLYTLRDINARNYLSPTYCSLLAVVNGRAVLSQSVESMVAKHKY